MYLGFRVEILMSFTVNVHNAGVDGTITVTEQVNDNEQKVVFDDVITAGTTIAVACVGGPPKSFTWIHHASNLVGGPVDKGDGDTIDVES
jgi:hypothetical protein